MASAGFLHEIKEENGADKKIAYVTFDDGPSDNTLKILDTLQEKKAVATFFLIGNEITKEREEIVKKTVKQGNAVGIHTFCHEKNVMYCNPESFMKDFQKACEKIQAVTGEIPRLHRFPWGSNNAFVSSYVDELRDKLKQQGIRSFDWNVSAEDSVGRGIPAATIKRNVMKDLEKYDQPIILMHDSATMKNTAGILGEILDEIREKGYGFATLETRSEYLFPASWR